ncbi:MAG: radical SAM protein, partial [Bacteroidales bacterium]|nr:radical SAM protein [Bacteroidales bacterium]
MNLLKPLTATPSDKKVYIETYGCQMNVNDSEVVLSILQDCGYRYTEQIEQADLILANTCSIRDNAEQRIWGRIDQFHLQRKKRPVIVGILGCMAERLKEKLIENGKVDIVVGPDSYRKLPELLKAAQEGQKGVETTLSREETYAELTPTRLDKNGVSAFISIMRGCNNVCSYCVVPYTRGAERSREPGSIVREACQLFENGYREVTLLGQNVDSYHWKSEGQDVDFADLLEKV